MAEIAEFTEQGIDYKEWYKNADCKIMNNLDAISHATCAMAVDVGAKCIVVSSKSGITARMVSRFRSPADIIGMTTSERALRKLNLSWGVTPVMCEMYPSTEVLFYSAMQITKKALKLKKGERIVITGGITNGQSGNTNLIKVEEI